MGWYQNPFFAVTNTSILKHCIHDLYKGNAHHAHSEFFLKDRYVYDSFLLYHFKLNALSYPYLYDEAIGVLGGIFHFYSNCDRKLCKQKVETPISRRVLQRLIWVCTVSLCPTKRTLGLYGLKVSHCLQYCIYLATRSQNCLPNNCIK